MADLFHFSPEQRQRIVICGIAAGFATVFGTPVAGAILGIEVLAIGDLWYEMLLPSFAASVTAYGTAHFLGLTWSYPRSSAALGLSLGVFWKLALFGVIAGLAAYLLVLLMDGLHHTMERLQTERHWWPPLFPLISGAALAALMLLGGRSYNGLSLPLLSQALSGHAVPAFGWAWKLLAVGITLGFGMSGGIITPLFVIGAALGSALAIPFHLPLAIGAELGMIAVTAAGANTPIALILMGMELFGARLAPEFLIVVIPACIIIGNNSVYPSQRVRLQKSPGCLFPLASPWKKRREVPCRFRGPGKSPRKRPRANLGRHPAMVVSAREAYA